MTTPEPAVTAKAWVVRATTPGLASFAARGELFVNCLVREDLTSLRPDDIVGLGPSRAHARELALLAQMHVGDLVIATDTGTSQVLVGTVTGEYAYRPDADAEHPHSRAVQWSPPTPRRVLKNVGLTFPGLWVKAIGEIDLDAASTELLRTLASTPTPTTGPERRPSRPPHQVTSDPQLLKALVRRIERVASWHDPLLAEEPTEVCRHRRRPCGRHSKHRYWLELPVRRPNPAGPNVLVVGANPTCPDIPAPDNTTVARVIAFADLLGAASIGMINVATRRSEQLADLRSVAPQERVGPRQGEMVEKALSQADVVVVGWGSSTARFLPEATREMSARLARAQKRGVVVVDPFGRQLHPQVWPVRATDAQGRSVLLHGLRRFSA